MQLFYVKLPGDIAKHKVILVDPMLATGGSALMAIGVCIAYFTVYAANIAVMLLLLCCLQELLRCGVQEENIVFVNVVSCPEGITALAHKYPAISILTAAVDDHLNGHKYIVPGLGDFGDRYFNTPG
jgi:uracil phosphoribosyltransferase